MAKTTLQQVFGEDLEVDDVLAVWLEDGAPVHEFLAKHVGEPPPTPDYVSYWKVTSVTAVIGGTGAVSVTLEAFNTTSGDQHTSQTRSIGRLDLCFVLNGSPSRLV